MDGIALQERNCLGALLEASSQAEVMAKIPQFSQAETGSFAPAPEGVPQALGVLMGRPPGGDRGFSPGLPPDPAL